MTKQELVEYVTGERNQIEYSHCHNRNDFNSLIHDVKKIISGLERAFLANPNEYVNLKMHIDKLKNDTLIGQNLDENEKRQMSDPKYFCKEARREVLSDLRNLISDNKDAKAGHLY